MADWVVPLATLLLTMPAALIALYRSLYGQDHKKMLELENRITALENTLEQCRTANARLTEENHRLLRRVVEAPDCHMQACPMKPARYGHVNPGTD